MEANGVECGLKVLVTGVGGFIGSSVAQKLLEDGHSVLGIDCFVNYYPRAIKERNLKHLQSFDGFRFLELDLSEVPFEQLTEWCGEYPYISHQAAQAGVRSSWGQQFEEYDRFNILVTQRLLEAAREVGVRRFVYASSSSVYGRSNEFPLREDGPTLPVSPYGVTKLAAEHLASLYHHNYGVPTVSLRYFTVYGPRQRPEMAFHRLIRSVLTNEPFPLYGDGSQSRNFTYIGDIVAANITALFKQDGDSHAPFLGQPVNIGGGARATVSEVIDLVEELTGKKATIERLDVQKGDVDRTEAELTRARQWLDYEPKTSLREGLMAQIQWTEELLREEGALV